MRPNLALSIGAVAFLLSGLPFILAPAQSMSALGWPTPDAAVVIARDGGVLMVGMAIVDWLARNAVGGPLLGLLWANIFIRVGGGLANVWEFAVGLTPATIGPALAVAVAIDLVLIIVFALALRRASEVAGGSRLVT